MRCSPWYGQWTLLFLLCGDGTALAQAAHPSAVRFSAGKVQATLPLRFEANRGQEDPRVKFVSGGQGYKLLLTDAGSVLQLSNGKRAASVTTTLRHAQRPSLLEGTEPLTTSTNYFRGGNSGNWITDVPSYARVRYGSVYPGIDLIFYGAGRQLEYDFVVAPGADPADIELEISKAARLRLNADGDLVLATAAGEVYWRKPEIYQMVEGRRQIVPGRFTLRGQGRVAFEVGRYDRARALVLDPTLSYSTYLGGSNNDAAARMVLDSAGNIYLAGITASVNLPLTVGGYQSAFQGGSAAFSLTGDAFVAKIDPTGSKAIYVTYLGGSNDDAGLGIAVDDAGNAYVTGYTNSANFPTLRPFQGAFAGPAAPHGFSSPNAAHPGGDAFVAKLNPAGNGLVYSTYFGGSSDDRGVAIAVDPAGNAYVAGMTLSTNFPFTPNAYQKTMKGTGGSPIFCSGCGLAFNAGDVFVAKFNADGSRAWATLLGGSLDDAPSSIVAAPDGSVWVAGATLSPDFPVSSSAFQKTYGGTFKGQIIQNIGDGFISHISADGSSLLYSTYLGGSNDDAILGMVLDSAGAIYVTGATSSANFPHTSGTYQGPTSLPASRVFLAGDAFVAKFNFAATNPLIFSMLLGGTDDDMAFAIAVDAAGNSFVAGGTESSNFPLVNPYQSKFGGKIGGDNRSAHAFLTEVDPTGTKILFSTLLGGSLIDLATGIALDTSGNVYLAGQTSSPDFPLQAPLQKTFGGGSDTNSTSGDAFIAKFSGFAAAAVPAVLNLSATASATSVTAGSNVTYTFTVNNAGPGSATNVKLAATFAGGAVQLTSASISAGSCSALTASLSCTVPSLSQGASAVLTIQGAAQAIGSGQAALSLTWDSGTAKSAQVAIAVVPPAGTLQFSAPVTQSSSSGAPVAVAFSNPNLFLLTANVEIYQNQPSPTARINLTPQTALQLPSDVPAVKLLALDLNGDQSTDLVVLDSSGAVTTYLAGNSGYTVGQNFPANPNPVAMATLNLDGDANPDLAVIGENGVALFTANGDGTFTPAGAFDVPGRQGKLLALGAGSFTGAGLDDLVLSDSGGNIWLYPSDGSGGFGTPTMAQAGSNSVALATGDFNGDGNLDVAVANSGSGNVSLLLGDGAGNFGAPTNFDVGGGPLALVAADLNGDGNLDLAVVVSSTNTLCLLRGDGAGNFQAPLQYLVGTAPVALAVGDIDGDGKPDVVVANRQSRDFSILLNAN